MSSAMVAMAARTAMSYIDIMIPHPCHLTSFTVILYLIILMY